MTALLEMRDLSVAFATARGTFRAVDCVDVVLDPGEVLCIVGESGSGKSVSMLAAMGLIQYPGEVRADAMRFDGTDLLAIGARQRRRLVGKDMAMIFQEPMSSLNPCYPVGWQIGEALRARVIDLLGQAGFADAEHRLDAFPHQLSGGQRQRVMIAMALASDPPLLIADEPTTALDVTIQAQILKLLAAQKAARGLALLLISHDLAVVRRYADRVCVMKNGRIVEAGRVEQVFGFPVHPYTCALLAAEPRGIARPLADGASVLTVADDVRVHFPIRRGILRRTVAHVKAVDGVSITVHQGETVGLVGESGSGKSTMGYAVLGLEHATTGHIRFEGHDVATMDRRRLRKLRARMQIVFQDPYGSLSPRLPVGDIVGEGLAVHEPGLPPAQRAARVAEALEEVGLPASAMERYPHEFSGGQRQRIAIARAMVLKPRFVVLDEPTSALDMSVQAQIVELLRRLQKDHHLGYLFISHDLKVVKALAHRVIVLRHGRVVEQGPAAEVLKRPREDYTRALIAAAFALEADESGVVAT